MAKGTSSGSGLTAAVVGEDNANRVRVLPATAAGCSFVGLVAMVTPWYTTLAVAGRVTRLGFAERGGQVVLVLGSLTLLSLVIACVRPRAAVWPGLAAVCAAVAALICVVNAEGGRDRGFARDGFSGGAPWVGGFAFAGACVLAVLAIKRSDHEPEPVAGQGGRYHRRDLYCTAMLVSALVAVAALFAPWSAGDGNDDVYSRDAFGRSGVLPAIELLTVTVSVVLLAVYRERQTPGRRTLLRAVSALGALVALIAAISVGAQGAGGLGVDRVVLIGPVVHVLALAVFAALAILLSQVGDLTQRRVHQPDRVGDLKMVVPGVRAACVSAVAASGLVLAAAGLVAPWQQVTSSALERLVGSDSVVRLGIELRSGLVLAVVVAGVALVALAAGWVDTLVHPLRHVVLVLGGITITVLALRAASVAELHGVNASFEAGIGPWLSAAGGLLTAVASFFGFGGLQLQRRNPRSKAVLAVVVVGAAISLSGLTVKTDSAARAVGADERAVLFAADDGTRGARLGGSARSAGVQNDGTTGHDSPNIIATDAGIFFEGHSYYNGYSTDLVIEQVLGGRALPVTTIMAADRVKLLTATGQRLLALVDNSSRRSVESLDMRDGDVVASSSTDDPHSLLRGDQDSGTTHPGSVPGELLGVQMGPDDDALVRTSRGTLRIDAAQVRSGRRWLARPTGRLDVLGPSGDGYIGGNSLTKVSSDTQRSTLAKTVKDVRCALSRDPFRSYPLFTVSLLPPRFAVDTSGDIWIALPYADHVPTRLVVLTSDGVLRRPAGDWSDTIGVQTTPDGSLIVTTGRRSTRGPIYRFADPMATARTAEPLPAVACR